MQEQTKRSACTAFPSAKDTAICITSSRAFCNRALTGFLKKHLWKINRAAAYYAIDKDVIAVTCYAKLGGWSKNSSYSEGHMSHLFSQRVPRVSSLKDETARLASFTKRNTHRSSISCNNFSSVRIEMCLYCLLFGWCIALFYESLLICPPGFNQCG